MNQEFRGDDELKGSGRGIVVDKSNATKTHPLRGKSIMDVLNDNAVLCHKPTTAVNSIQQQKSADIKQCLSNLYKKVFN